VTDYWGSARSGVTDYWGSARSGVTDYWGSARSGMTDYWGSARSGMAGYCSLAAVKTTLAAVGRLESSRPVCGGLFFPCRLELRGLLLRRVGLPASSAV